MDTNARVAFTVQQTELFVSWRRRLRDVKARAAIVRRLDRISAGLLGDWKSVGDGVSELRIDIGPGYRLYYTIRGRTIVILLCGGEKRTQAADIRAARKLAKEV